jgi:DNA mismatch endonuclease (patch repair protein)
VDTAARRQPLRNYSSQCQRMSRPNDCGDRISPGFATGPQLRPSPKPQEGVGVSEDSTAAHKSLQSHATLDGPMDNLTREKRSKVMRAIKGRDTLPELCVRRLVYSLGYRYRIGDKRLPGRPDLVFKSRKKVIFVHGCFWHVHGRCSLSHIPAQSFWQKKLQANKNRDTNVIRKLREECWECLVIWECELKSSELVRAKILNFLGRRSSPT